MAGGGTSRDEMVIEEGAQSPLVLEAWFPEILLCQVPVFP